jgi:hypothetical protein
MGKREKLKQDKSRLARLANGSITIEAFMARILGVRNQRVLANRITHNDLKDLFPDLRRPSFDYVLDNPRTVSMGEVFMVSDCQGRVVPYFNPHYVIEEIEYYGTYEDQEPVSEPTPVIDDVDLMDMSTYDLAQLMHAYHDKNNRGAYRRVHEELVSRKDSHHASCESKGRALRKENKNKRHDNES